MRDFESRLCSGRSKLCCSCTVLPWGGFTIWGRLPSVMRNSAPSSRTSMWGRRSAKLRSTRSRNWSDSVTWQSADTM